MYSSYLGWVVDDLAYFHHPAGADLSTYPGTSPKSSQKLCERIISFINKRFLCHEDKLGAHHELRLERLVLDVVKLDEVGDDGEVGMASDAPAEDGLGSVDVNRHRV